MSRSASDLFYVERHAVLPRRSTATAEARWHPVVAVQRDRRRGGRRTTESFGAPQRIDRATGSLVAAPADAQDAIRPDQLGAYVSSNLKVLDPWLKLTGGVRYDHHSDYGAQITGRVGPHVALEQRRRRQAALRQRLQGSVAVPALRVAAAPRRRRRQPGAQAAAHPYRRVPAVVEARPLLRHHVRRLVQLAARQGGVHAAGHQPDRAQRRQPAHALLGDARRRPPLRRLHRLRLLRVGALGARPRPGGLRGDRWSARRTSSTRPGSRAAGVTFAVPSLPSCAAHAGRRRACWWGRAAPPTPASSSNGASFTLPSYLMLDLSLATRDLYLFPGHESRIALRGKNILAAKGPIRAPPASNIPSRRSSSFSNSGPRYEHDSALALRGRAFVLCRRVLGGRGERPGRNHDRPAPAPFTGGRSWATATNFERAVLYARDRINEGGGPKGRHVRIVSADTHSGVERAKQSAADLVGAGALVVIGPESAEIAAEIKPILDEHGDLPLSSRRRSRRPRRRLHDGLVSTGPVFTRARRSARETDDRGVAEQCGGAPFRRSV